ncbi:MAG: ERF family protein [Bacteroidaceae bacterium]|nr:ERF family protein [Bacteroidaceae bacterium]
MKELIEIQSTLKVQKKREVKNASQKVLYTYRSCEDILEAVKDLLKKQKCTLILVDEVVPIANRIYIKATATIKNETGESESASAFAREPDALGTMTQPQVTGTASSYARKYALNGLFAIDDATDADSVPQDAQGEAQQVQKIDVSEILVCAKDAIIQANTAEDLMRIYNSYAVLHTCKEFMEALTSRRKALGI